MKRFCLPLLSAFCFQLSLTAQDLSSFESMKSAFGKATSDTAKLRILFDAKPMKYMNTPDALLALYQQGYLLAKRQNDKVNRFKAVHYIALTYMYGKLDENTAYQWLQKALKEAEAAQNNVYIGWVYYAIGIIHDHQGERQEMYRAFYRSIDYLEKADEFYSGTFVALSQNLEVDKKWKEQLAVTKRLVSLLERLQAPAVEKLTSYNNLVDALKHFPERKREIAYYRTKTLEFLDKIPASDLYSDDILIIASIYHKYDHFDLAVKYAKQVAAITDTAGYNLPNKGLAHKFLAELYEERKQYDRSLHHLKQYQMIEANQITQRMNDDAGKKIIKAQAERNIAIKQKEIEQQQLFTYFAIAIAGLVILLSGLMYHFYRREQARKAELQRINNTKDKLFAILSHDLRAPVNSLRSYFMLMDWGALNQAEFAAATHRLKTQLWYVNDMLENVLNWSISQMGGIRPHKGRVAIAPVADEQIKLLLPAMEAKNIQFMNDIPNDAHVRVDKNHLAIIIRNLLHNAVKFTHPWGKITLAYYEKKRIGYIEVKDTGVGMSKERLNKLFELDKGSSGMGTDLEPGTGLGLVLVKELADANGGTIAVGSEPGQGTRFVIGFQKEPKLLIRSA